MIKDKTYLFGEIATSKSAGSGSMVMSGFVSTDDVDLAGDIIEPTAFDKYLDAYKRNPIYCYDHDASLPIGKVLNPYVVHEGTKRGLYLEDITLTHLPVVDEIIWPLVQDGVLTQQSICFRPLEAKMVAGINHFTSVYVLESSLVPIACNPHATIDAVKQLTKGLWVDDGEWERISGVEGLQRALMEGRLRLPSSAKSSFVVPEICVVKSEPEGEKLVEKQIPDFMDIDVLAANKELYDPEGAIVAKPYRNQKGYNEVCDNLYAAKSMARGGYIFQLADPTTKGYKYAWEKVAMSMARALGAQGGFYATAEQKDAIISRIAEAYRCLDKKTPGIFVNDKNEKVFVPVDTLIPGEIEKYVFSDVVWREDEQDLIENQVLENAMKTAQDTVAHWKNAGKDINEAVRKWVYGWIDVYFGIPVSDPEALAFLESIMSVIHEYMDAKDDSTSPLLFSGPEGTEKEINYQRLIDFLAAKAESQKQNSAKEDSSVEVEEQKSVAEEPMSEEQLAILAELKAVLDRF